MENRCIICGKKLHDPFAIYCAECEYELKRARLADEESVEEYINRVKIEEINVDIKGIKPLDNWF
jgi:DNA-directed RNA polymerase subunit N (RpoN/RPB10)